MPYPYVFAALMAVATALLTIAAFIPSLLLIVVASLIAGAGLAFMLVDIIEVRRLIRKRLDNVQTQ